ncbi:DNA circularization N-terminal domain-containing protein [Klebsiella pneumoniae]|uniref:DNA circularization protein n=1 Tax=Klebsiella pneumoniae TaxID=573 RepID=UPI002230D563|nr:DNA circularization N-terminal domain-containing protein [Klebsiella pneumoniae]MDM9245090.1 DNA circularization N-terminal domain-containing protein [Klebsiella pneumoniae]
MAWETDLQDASFRGVAFDIITARDSVQRDIAQHEYPYRNGANIEDLGGKPRSLQCQAVFFGDDYESRLQAFIAALDTRGPGELIHPVFGSMPDMLCYVYQVNHDAENPDYCTVDLQFLQSGLDVEFFVREWPLSQADAIFNQAQGILDNAATLLDNAMKPLRTARQYLARAKALGVTALNMVAVLRGDITGFISSTTDFVNFPSAFMNDIQSALSLQSSAAMSSISSDSAVYASAPAVVIADWAAVKTQADEVAALPAGLVTGDVTASVEMPANVTTSDIRELIAMTMISVAIELAQQASDLLSDETITASLSPDDISLIAGDARQAVQNAIDSVRSTWAAEMENVSSSATSIALEYQPVIDGLRDTALSLQSMAVALINARPPMIQRTVASTTNLHLLAHLWYGDYTRAGELKLLNPSLRDPNNIIPGDVLNGYAE